MRIIGGDLKGKKILLPEDSNTRPLRDMVKESIFNILAHSNKFNVHVENSILFLNLFGYPLEHKTMQILFFFAK